MLKRKKWLFFPLALLLIVIAWLILRPGRTSADGFEFVKIDRGDLEAIVSSTGTLSAVTTVQVGTQVSGRIAKIYADFNQQVKQDQLLAVLDTAPLIQQVNEAESTNERARVQLKQAQLEFDRTTYLFKEKIKTQNDLDQVEINLELAKATLKAAQSSLERARINLTYASIYSPIDGVVIARNIDVGQTVAASFQAPVLFLIANNLKKMQILANVDEADIGQIKDGQPVRFTVQSFPNDKFSGTVTQIRMQSTTAQNVVTYTVVVQVDNSGGKLLPGMTATIDFLVGQAHDVLLVANAALRIKPTPAMLAELRKIFQQRSGQVGAGQSSPNPGSSGNTNNSQAERRANGFGNGQFQRPKDVALLWYLDKDGQLKATRVRIGISDGQMTAIISGDVQEGMEVIKTMRNELSGDTASTPRQGTPRRVMMF